MQEFHHTEDKMPASGEAIPYPDDYLRAVLKSVDNVAVVGFHADTDSHRASEELAMQGFRVIPVSEAHVGEVHVGEVVPARIADIPSRIDMVVVFGTPKDAEIAAAGAARAKKPFGLKALWFGPGARNDEAARHAEAAGLLVVEDRDPATEAKRLLS